MAEVRQLIDKIYEAGTQPHLWSETLTALAHMHGAVGVNLIRRSADGIQVVSTPDILEMAEEFDAGGWHQHNTRVARALDRHPHPGFLTDSDLHTPEELETLPMYAEFLNPRNAAAGAGTVIQGLEDDAVILALEGFRDHPASREAVPLLDRLRPHLARAVSLSAKIEAIRARSILDAFDACAAAVALLRPDGRLVGANELFQKNAEGLVHIRGGTLAMVDPVSRQRYADALKVIDSARAGSSIALRDGGKAGVAVLHIVPARNENENIFTNIAAYAVLAKPSNDILPTSDIISALFDLTPVEARVARAIAGGESVNDIAAQFGVSRETIRSHLKRVFQKTCVNRQSELAVLLGRFR